MNLSLDDQQQQLRQSLERFLADRYGAEQRESSVTSGRGFSPQVWEQFAQMGLLALPFSPDDGGLGLGPVDTMIVMQALGGALSVEPYLSTVVLCGAVLRRAQQSPQISDLIGKVAAGTLRLALAHSDSDDPDNTPGVTATALRVGDGFVISGDKRLVLHGDSAGKFIVSARLGDSTELGLFLIDAQADGVERRGFRMLDDTGAADLSLRNVSAPAEALISRQGRGLVEAAIDEAISALCAEAVGAMDALLALTVEHLKARHQFGAPLATFQSLQHRLADMYVMVEQARSLAIFAAISMAADGADERGRAASTAKVQIGRSARFVGQQAIQLHGAIGLTQDLKAGRLFKRLTVIEHLFGDADHHVAVLAAAGG